MAASEWVLVRLRMQDANKFIADARAAGASVRQMGRDSDNAAGLFDRLTHRSFWLQQALFTVRRVLYSVTLALGALTGAAIVMGFKFNSVIEQQTIAFTRFTGSAALATREINYLFNLAATTPFEFQQVIQADRQLMAFGFTAKQTRPILVALSDAMAGMGLDQSALDRATLALGQIRSTGRLLGQDLRQLEQLGLVSPEDLAKRLHVPMQSIMQPGTLNIPSEKAIDAIVAYWQSRFHGAAQEFQRTWTGELSTLHDIGAQTFGAMVRPLQDRLEKRIIPDITQIAISARKGFQTGGMHGFFAAIDKGAGQGTQLATTWDRVAKAGSALFHIVRDIADSFLFAWRMVRPGLFILTPLVAILGTLAWVLDHLQWPLRVFVTLLVAERTALILSTLWAGRKVGMMILEWIWTRLVSVAMTAYIIALYAQQFAMKLGVLWTGLMTIATIILESAVWGAVASFVALTVAFLASPVGWVVLAIVGLGAAFVVLYKKWDRFHDIVQVVWDELKRFWNWLEGHNWDRLNPLGGTGGGRKFLGIPLGGFHWPRNPFAGGQHGGTIAMGGGIMVGEHGPEIVSLPRAATITPLNADDIPGLAGAFAGVREILIRVPLVVDGRELAEATARYQLGEAARA